MARTLACPLRVHGGSEKLPLTFTSSQPYLGAGEILKSIGGLRDIDHLTHRLPISLYKYRISPIYQIRTEAGKMVLSLCLFQLTILFKAFDITFLWLFIK